MKLKSRLKETPAEELHEIARFWGLTPEMIGPVETEQTGLIYS